jgi:hypothetical protein
MADFEVLSSEEVARSDVAAVLNRAGTVRASFGWLMGSWILLRAIAAADRKRGVLGWGVVGAITAGLFQAWLKTRSYP